MKIYIHCWIQNFTDHSYNTMNYNEGILAGRSVHPLETVYFKSIIHVSFYKPEQNTN